MITDPHFVIYGNEIESKGVQASFPADVSLIKLIGAANYDLQLPVYSSNFSAWHSNTRLGRVPTNATTAFG